MKKHELEAIGLNNEQIRAVQRMNGADIMRERTKSDSKTLYIINALEAVLKLLPAESLHELFVYATTIYNRQSSAPNLTTPGMTQPEEPGNEN